LQSAKGQVTIKSAKKVNIKGPTATMTKSRLNDSEYQASPEQTGEILSDIRQSGKPRQWSNYKKQSLAIADAYSFFDELIKYANQIAECGSWLKFVACPQGHHKRLINASFCKCRLCVMCQWRKSLTMYHQVFTLIHAHREKYKSDIPLLLTLTIPNVSANDLNDSLTMMQRSLKKMMQRRGTRRSVRSWFRSLEITYKAERDDYHPHYHLLLLVPKNYFDPKYGLYIDQSVWLTMWQEATGIPEITQVDIRLVKKRRNGAIESVSAEVAKYATKPSTYVNREPSGDFTANSEVVKTLHDALKGRRLVAFGGLFGQLRKELKLKDIEQANLVNITEDEQPCTCPICQSTLREELYRWQIGVRQYVG